MVGLSVAAVPDAPAPAIREVAHRSAGPDGGDMTVIVLEESRREMSEDFGPGDVVSYIGKIHAAPADPSIPGDPADRFCGKDTSGMDKLTYQPSRPGASWYPPNNQEDFRAER